MLSTEQIYLIALGGNMPSDAGAPSETLTAALSDIKAKCGKVEAVSPFYETPCFPAGAGPDYVNAALRLRSERQPKQLLEALHEIEAKYGRARETRWGQRTLDLDLLAAGNNIYPDKQTFEHWHDLSLEEQKIRAPTELLLPHPRMHERAFVLIPLRDVAPDWRHPITSLSVVEMCEALPTPEKAAVKRL